MNNWDYDDVKYTCPSNQDLIDFSIHIGALFKTHPIYQMKCLYIDGLVQEKHNSIAYTLELCLSCTKSSIFCSPFSFFPFILYSVILGAVCYISYHV